MESRTKYCGEFNKNDIKKTVVAVGWVAKQRDLGNLIFIDLRDRSGIVQLAIDEKKTDTQSFKNAFLCRLEFVVFAKGTVKKRKEENKKIKTGEIEICVQELKILSKAKTPPFNIAKSEESSLEIRLKHRYLDLRNEKMQNVFFMRHKIVKFTRDFFDENGFLEIETPMLIKSTPEGARDYLVPSRVHKSKFYALPQSPQLYKQLLMVSGFDRYLQIARCFRDEDLRADRQPEFSQIDLEMSFVEQEDIIKLNEEYVKKLFEKILNIKIKTPFLRLSYEAAMQKYGSDKPDIRFDMQLMDIKEAVLNSSLKVFENAIKNNGAVYAINLKNMAENVSRKELDKLTELVKRYKAKGLFYSKISNQNTTSNYEKFLNENEIAKIYDITKAEKNDLILIVADEKKEIVQTSLGMLRTHLAKTFNLYDENEFAFLWVNNFPLFEFSEEENRYVSKHHPFTAMLEEDLTLLTKCPEKCHAKAFDLVLNGCEVGGGSIRINDENIQNELFKALNFSEKEIEEKFGFLIEAFKYGAPPHGGMAYGLDRLVMLMLKKESIRDVIAFPKVQDASELMTNSPSSVLPSQLKELNIKTLD